MNAAIRAVVRCGTARDAEMVGIRRAYSGVIEETRVPSAIAASAGSSSAVERSSAARVRRRSSRRGDESPRLSRRMGRWRRA